MPFEVYEISTTSMAEISTTSISFIMSDIWPHFVSGADLGNPWVDPLNIAHAHPLGGVDVPFGFMKFDQLANHRS